jgi:hypothetical protein
MAQTKPVSAKETPSEKGVVTDSSIKKPEVQETAAKVEVPKKPEVERTAEEPTVVEEPVIKKTQVATQAAAPQVDKTEQEVESVLEEDIKEMYLAMNPADRQAFKVKGEEVTVKIVEILSSAKVNAKKIFHLIRDWLKIIPGVSKFFLEQEAKIKTDKLIILSERKNKNKNQEIE